MNINKTKVMKSDKRRVRKEKPLWIIKIDGVSTAVRTSLKIQISDDNRENDDTK